MESRPIIVCLCGSTRFKQMWLRTILRESLEGKIVLSVACYPHAENVVLTTEQRQTLDDVHLHKIALADEVLVLDVGGYIGETTASEIVYAVSLGKRIRYLSLESGQQILHRQRQNG